MGKHLYWASGWNTQEKVQGDFSDAFVTRLQSGDGRKGNLWQGPTYHNGAPGHLGGVLTAYFQGCWGSKKEKGKKNSVKF